MNRNFLDHYNNKPNFYYANWDLCKIASLMAIGIFNGNAIMYELSDAVVANGALFFSFDANHTEEGLEKAHTLIDFPLLGVIGQQGYNQNVDLYATSGNQILNGWEGVLPVVASKSRFDIRSGFEAIYSHYAEIKGLNALWSRTYRDYINKILKANIESVDGDYSPNSGGYNALGHGTLMYRLGKSW
ncbi:putative gpi anchored protein [Botrytis fragariae]|uniref:Putative gpi anchored protein n=1 Tax=Botrytis fragariae TaxID=1964551 RepID=A0A8H6EDJ6_9HELO|nr:putative gpi anchored protein [Botrytis fragariae]KAF5868382.1 putative gpi anchored protein [Botrytis fragariae]